MKNKKIISLLLAALLMLSLCGCAIEDELFPECEESVFAESADSAYDYRANIVPFADMVYERPDIDAMQSLADEISGMLKEFFKRDEVVEKLNDYFTLYYKFHTMEALAGIRSDMNVTDSYNSGEYSYCSSLEASVSRMTDELMCDCANSRISNFLDSQYFGGYLSEHYSYDGKFSYTDELVDLYNKENSLLSDYRMVFAQIQSEGGSSAYTKYNESACNIYIDLIKTRKAIADELGYDSYEDYMFYSYSRDYEPSDLADYIAAIKENIVPLYKSAYNSGMMNEMYRGLNKLSDGEATELLLSFVSKMPAEIGEAFSFMEDYGLCSITTDDNATNISYTTYLDDYDAPFMLVKSNGYAENMLTVTHEFGHFCDQYINRDRNDNLDATEVMSQGLEYLMLCNLDDNSLASALTRYKMLDELYLYVNQASFYEFEQRVFVLSDEELTVSNVNEIFGDVAKEYGYFVDSSTNYAWIDINHLFEYPFYVISYCTSDSAAFSLYNMELNSPGEGIDMYVRLLENASSSSFVGLLEEQGMSSPISKETIAEIADVLRDRLGISA